MNQEVKDLLGLLTAVHESIDKMVEDLSDAEWLAKPRADFNNVASVLEHIALVEHRFLTVLDGKSPEATSRNPFTADSWDVAAIRQSFAAALPYAKDVLERMDVSTLDTHAIKLGIGDVDRRQLLAYTIAHTTHHRGQIPLIKKLIRS